MPPPPGSRLILQRRIADVLARYRVDTVVHTAGPFQGQDYTVARTCLRSGCHYIDLADARDFVAGIAALDAEAKGNVLLASGASSVPGLSSAVVNRFLPEFAELHGIRHGISTGAKPRDCHDARVLSYSGKPFLRLEEGQWRTAHGWQGLRRRRFPPPVGSRSWALQCPRPRTVSEALPGVRR